MISNAQFLCSVSLQTLTCLENKEYLTVAIYVYMLVKVKVY